MSTVYSISCTRMHHTDAEWWWWCAQAPYCTDFNQEIYISAARVVSERRNQGKRLTDWLDKELIYNAYAFIDSLSNWSVHYATACTTQRHQQFSIEASKIIAKSLRNCLLSSKFGKPTKFAPKISGWIFARTATIEFCLFGERTSTLDKSSPSSSHAQVRQVTQHSRPFKATIFEYLWKAQSMCSRDNQYPSIGGRKLIFRMSSRADSLASSTNKISTENS